MNGNILDVIDGKQYNLATFENEMVKVESAGRCIRVSLKCGRTDPLGWWEPVYPFTPPPPGLSWDRMNGWLFEVRVTSPQVAEAIFEKEGERHILTLRVTDPTADPKPIEVTWE